MKTLQISLGAIFLDFMMQKREQKKFYNAQNWYDTQKITCYEIIRLKNLIKSSLCVKSLVH